MNKGLYLIVFLVLWMLSTQAIGQSCADCSIDIPYLGTPEQIGEPTILYYSSTGVAADCGVAITDPHWTVTGNAQIITGTNEDVIRIEASGDFQLGLEYLNNNSGSTEYCLLETASNIILNPSLDLDCGLDLILVLDESNSISHNEEDAVRESVRSLLEHLEDSGSNISIVEFATRANAESFDCAIAGSPNYVEINSANINGCLNTYLTDDYGDPAPYSGGTNWDDGLLKVLDVINNNTIQPDLVLFITDGNPTFYIDEHNSDHLGGSGYATKVSAVNHANVRANEIKAHARIFGMGIGNNVNAQNLKFISGINAFAGDLSTSDYMITSDFSELATDLTSLANSLCGTDLSVLQSGPSCVSGTDPSVTFHIDIENNGDMDADDVEVFEVFPPGFQFTSETRSSEIGTISAIGNLRIWDIGTLTSGESVSWIINGTLPTGETQYESTAYAIASNIDPGANDTSRIVIYPGSIVLSESHTDNSCSGNTDGSVNLIIDGGVPPYSIYWSNGETTEDIEDLPSGSYSATVEDFNGCTASIEVLIEHPDMVPLYVHVDASDDWICNGERVILRGPEGFEDNQWYYNGQAITGANSNVLEVVEAGSYMLSVEDMDLCAAGFSENIEISTDAIATRPDTIYTDLSDLSGAEVCLESALELSIPSIGAIWAHQDAEHVDYVLDDAAMCMELFKIDEEFETDTIVLIACDTSRCINCDSSVIVIRNSIQPEPPVVEDQFDCLIPDVITPNGDGFNEYFYIGCIDEIEEISLHVYNRWGTEVYFSNAYNNNWNGTYQGMPLPYGTYYFILKFVNPENEHINLAGDLTIVR